MMDDFSPDVSLKTQPTESTGALNYTHRTRLLMTLNHRKFTPFHNLRFISLVNKFQLVRAKNKTSLLVPIHFHENYLQ